jgi:hypothetical protein
LKIIETEQGGKSGQKNNITLSPLVPFSIDKPHWTLFKLQAWGGEGETGEKRQERKGLPQRPNDDLSQATKRSDREAIKAGDWCRQKPSVLDWEKGGF